jgi:hypothetical protein
MKLSNSRSMRKRPGGSFAARPARISISAAITKYASVRPPSLIMPTILKGSRGLNGSSIWWSRRYSVDDTNVIITYAGGALELHGNGRETKIMVAA